MSLNEYCTEGYLEARNYVYHRISVPEESSTNMDIQDIVFRVPVEERKDHLDKLISKLRKVQDTEARRYIIENWQQYHLDLKSKEEMIALINILEAHGETLDSLHDYECQGGRNKFCDIYMSDANTDSEIVSVLFENHVFYQGGITNEEFLEIWAEQAEDFDGEFGDFMWQENLFVTLDGIVMFYGC